jgi:Predicted DNA-binding proteins
MTLDEFESLRLADLEGLYQEEASARMKVSRSTFSRIGRHAFR